MSDLFEQAKTRILDRIESPRDLLEFKLGAALKMERTVLGMLDTLHDEARRDELNISWTASTINHKSATR